MSGPASSRALILDVDGVVSPVHGHTIWGDDVVAGQVFGPVVVSPTMCQRLDHLAELPDVQAVWLTSWPRHLRHRMDPFPGRAWPQISRRPRDQDRGWWKWAALLRWLDQSRGRFSALAWCDDHLTNGHLDELQDAVYRLSAFDAELSRRRIRALLLAPGTAEGLTADQVDQVERFLAPC